MDKHCHSLLWISGPSRVREDKDVDLCISAELQDPIQDSEDYRIVSEELMMHGQCGLANTSAPCMKDGTCNHHFPKAYSNSKYIDTDGYVHCRRRETGTDTQRLANG
ncbi:hypothetical protein Tco_0476242 [Tanacetum coccineum]